jgi:hypothetical protein
MSWTDKLLLAAVEKGAVIRTRERVAVEWKPRHENDGQPWAPTRSLVFRDQRYAAWYLHAEQPNGCPWMEGRPED